MKETQFWNTNKRKLFFKFEALYLGKSTLSEKVENYRSKNRTRKQRFQSNGKTIASDTTKVSSESTFVRNGYQKLTCCQRYNAVGFTKNLKPTFFNRMQLNWLFLSLLLSEAGSNLFESQTVTVVWCIHVIHSLICSNHLTGIDELKGRYSWTWAKASWLKAI